MKTSVVLALAGLTSIATAGPIAPSRTRKIEARQDNSTTSAPCAQVSQTMYGNGNTVVTQELPAKLAWDCINSVPFNATSAKRLIKSIRPYIDWQSTLVTLKNPPADYANKVQPPIDIIGGLDKIDSDIDSGRFKNEYDFGWTLYTLFQSAHDGHFGYTPDSVGGIFTWGRRMPLVSVSEDGKQLPGIFAFSDVVGLQFKNISYTPSPVVEIDGMQATEFLENLSQRGSLQDRDALYNNVFYELAQVSLGSSGSGTGMFTGGGRGRLVYPGPTTTLKFANGSDYTMQNYARALINFRNVTSGEELAKRWFSFGSEADAVQIQSEKPAPEPETPGFQLAADGAPGYPNPVVPGPMNLINGFYINAPGYEDVAVLQVPNFVGVSSVEVPFQQLTQNFIPKALADGKTKLIIDLQANGGGTILQGYDMFKQLFPDLDPYGANRFRATESANLIGQSFSAYASQFPRVATKNNTILQAQASYFDYHNDMKVDGTPFSSWQEKFGPEEVNGDKYTTLNRWNLSDVHVTYSSGGINITGYGPLANVTGPPKFKAENIVLVTDGYCASTCTIFSELMTKQAGVKTITMGGRSNKNKIQAIGGVKGVNNYQFGYIQNLAQYAVRYTPSLDTSILKRDFYSDIPFNRAAGSPGVNTRDGLRKGDDSGVALQFVYEEADCRLYYTPEMTVDITSLWKAAADAQWGNSGKCVAGGHYGKKRNARDVTARLSPRRVQVSQATAMKRVQAFENSFALETECKMSGDGFMLP